MRRRNFLAFLGGTAAWPLVARAQQPTGMRRIGVLLYLNEQDVESKTYLAAFVKQLSELGWRAGGNLQIDYRWTGGNVARLRQYAAELVALSPDVILAAGGSHVGPLQQLTRTIPIVFVQVADPVGGGFVESLAHPGGNATGFSNFEFDISGKWLELLREIAPHTVRTAVLRDPSNPTGTAQFGAIQALGRALGIDVTPIGLRDAAEIERGIGEFAARSNGGLIITPTGLAIVHRALIIALAERYRLPAVYPFRFFVSDGGLISYGPDAVDQYRRAAGYVDRILKGEKPAGLPVEQSTKVALVINLKTAKALGLDGAADAARARRRGDRMISRREFITLLSGAAAAGWPLAAKAQQAMPVVGILGISAPDTIGDRLRMFRLGLKEAGYIDGENLVIEYRWTENQFDRLPELVADFVRKRVAVITTVAGASLAAKLATTSIPIVFIATEDPVRLGLVASLARPGGNLTGINIFSAELVAKRLELVRELLPSATRIAVLIRPTGPSSEATLRDIEPAAHVLGLQVQVLNASTAREIDAAFATLRRERLDALFLGADPFFTSRRVQLANLATRHVVPMISATREVPEAGGLISYGANIADGWRQVGVYVGRILRGTKPADLPVVQSTKFELVINAQTARILGVDVPAGLLARADEVIE